MSTPRQLPATWLLVGGVALVVGPLVFAAVLAHTIGAALWGEPQTTRELLGSGCCAGLGAIVVWVGWRASTREQQVGHAGLETLALVARVLVALGLFLGSCVGVWAVQQRLASLRAVDLTTCESFTGPLAPLDPEACVVVARDCRHQVAAGPEPKLARGLRSDAPTTPVGLELPGDAEGQAQVWCTHSRRAEFGR